MIFSLMTLKNSPIFYVATSLLLWNALIEPCSSQLDIGIGFQVVPSDHNTNHHNYGSSGPNVLDLLQDTGDKASSLIRDVGDRTRWILKEKINTKVKAIRNILPKIPSGYSFPSASYGLP